MLHNRKYEIELLYRHLNDRLKFDSNRLYHEDIKNVWDTIDILGLPDALYREVFERDIILQMAKDKEIKRVITEFSNKRKIAEHAKELMQNIDNHDKLEQLIHSFELDRSTEVKVINNEQLANERLEHIIKVADGIIPPGLLTHTPIDKIDGGLRNEYILLAARPSVGKSVLGLQIAINIARTGKKVAFFSLEMSAEALIERFLYNLAHVNANNAKKRILSSDQRVKLKSAVQAIGELPIDIIDEKCDIYDIISKSKEKEYDVVIVDYLQKIKTHRNADRRIIVEEISGELADLPKDIKAPVIVISSLSRPKDGNENKPPTMLELKETGNLEFDADVITLLHREKEGGVYSNKTDVFCTKNRNGQTGYIEMTIHGGVYKFE